MGFKIINFSLEDVEFFQLPKNKQKDKTSQQNKTDTRVSESLFYFRTRKINEKTTDSFVLTFSSF